MCALQRISYSGLLPDSFFSIHDEIYASLPFKPEEDKKTVIALFESESTSSDVVIYTDHKSIRLVGIFPPDGSEAFFGFWEGVNNSALHIQAFSMLEADAKTKNKRTITGPINFNTFHQYRLRLGNPPDWNMFDREPVNPDFYPSLLKGFGFSEKALFESRLIKKENVEQLYKQKSELLTHISEIPFDFISINEEIWKLYQDEIFELIHAIFSENPQYRSIPANQFKLLYNLDYARKLCPFSSVIVKDRQSGSLAAISLCCPNYKLLNPGIYQQDFKLDFGRLSRKTLLAKTVGVHPDFRRRGLMNFMGAHAMLSFKEHYDEVLFCLMRSDNFSAHFTDGLTYESAKYALYERELF